MTTRSRFVGVSVLVALVVASPLATRRVVGDLEVGVPPGNPQDWTSSYPQPTITGLGRVPRAGGVGSVEVTPFTRDGYVQASSIFDFSGITTRDLPSELPWTQPEITKAPPIEISRAGGPPVPTLRYPPHVSDYMHWLAMATLLRAAMHPAQVSEAETIEHLVLLGVPALSAARRAMQEAAMRDLAELVARRIEPLPNRAPELPAGKDPYVQMMLRLAWIELGSGTPYDPSRPFAARLRMLEQDGLSPVLECSRSKHPLLRRNAATLLAEYDGEPAAARLRELTDDSDLCVRNRALRGLFSIKDAAMVEPLIRCLKSSDRGLAVICAEGLGRIGDARAVEPLLDFMARNARDADVWWAALPALARIASGEPAHLAALEQLRAGLDRDKERFALSAAQKQRAQRVAADSADPLPRRTVLVQLGTIAAAAMGSADARNGLLDTIGGRDQKAMTPEQKRIADLQAQYAALQREMQKMQGRLQGGVTDPEAQRKLMEEFQDVNRRLMLVYQELVKIDPRLAIGLGGRAGLALGPIAAAARFACCEALARMGRDGHAVLARVAEDATESAQLRAHAFDKIDHTLLHDFVEVGETLKYAAVDDKRPSLVRTRALARLERADPVLAATTARDVVEHWLRQPAVSLPSLEHWVALDAIRMLGRLGKCTVELTERVIAHAQEERAQAELRRAAHEQQLEQARQQGMAFFQLELAVFDLPPILEAALLEQGRLGTDDAVAKLLSRLDDATFLARPHAALAVELAPGATVTPRLVEGLADKDPWVRLMCYRVLRARTGQDFATDWIFGEVEDLKVAVRAWREWLGKAKK